MCGLTGVFNTDGAPVSAATLRSMTDAIAHRGPDGEGTFTDGAIGLGHRRLAIIDLTPAGGQPMASPDGEVVLAYNGEIYNFRELRSELEGEGFGFRSRTDTEVVLNAYLAWGEDCVRRFNGMFAFALWDGRRGRLLLARDRYGIKPLYYARVGSTVLFGSEVKALLRHPDFRAELSHPHLLEYFTFQNVFSDGTLFRGVRLLPPGCTLTVSRGRAEPCQRRYWDYRFRESGPTRADPREYEEELDRLFRQAVRRQLVSDVPVGAYLSGGMDSGSITAVAAEELPRLCTFTGGFDLSAASAVEQGFDERRKAAALSTLMGTDHHEVILEAADMERCLSDLVWHLEDPRVGQSYPNFHVARLASRFVKVVLSGAGGDELFAGYPWRYYGALGAGHDTEFVPRYYSFWNRLVPHERLRDFFSPGVWSEVEGVRPLEIFRSVLEGWGGAPETPEDHVNQALYFEAKTFLHGLLVVEDKLSMAYGLETRVPFLDDDLVEFAQSIPVSMKLRDLQRAASMAADDPRRRELLDRSRDGKLVLRRVMGRYVPTEVTDQVKQGFSGPDASWFRGASMEYVRDVVHSPDAHMYEYLDRETVQSLVDEHFRGAENRRLLIWSLLNFEEWCRAFLNGRRD